MDIFANRVEAGARLAVRLGRRHADHPLVLGLPRGGVPVAAEVARGLAAPLDILGVRKIGVPWQPELALGAVGEDGVAVINDDVAGRSGLSAAEVGGLAAAAADALAQRLRALRGDAPIRDPKGRAVIIVDDGIATGATMGAAVQVARRRGATQVVVAVPVAAPEAMAVLRGRADSVVCLLQPEWMSGVAAYYVDFGQVAEVTVRRLLEDTVADRDRSTAP